MMAGYHPNSVVKSNCFSVHSEHVACFYPNPPHPSCERGGQSNLKIPFHARGVLVVREYVRYVWTIRADIRK